MIKYVRHWFGAHDFTKATRVEPNTKHTVLGITFVSETFPIECKVCTVCKMAHMKLLSYGWPPTNEKAN